MLGKLILTAKGCKDFPQIEELVELHIQNSMKPQNAHPLMQVPNVVLKSRSSRFLPVKLLFRFSSMG